MSVASALAGVLREVLADEDRGLESYRGRPVDFQREVLGYEPIPEQARILEELERGWVSVPAGRAMGKSRIDGGAALYFAATRPNACVVLIAPTFRQVQTILWEEIRVLYRGAKVPLGGRLGIRCETGGRLSNGSRLFGLTGDQPESIQGIRAPEMMVIADEASGIGDEMFHALLGNLAGGGRLLLTGNPTRSRGYFREACRSERFTRIHLPSTASPNVREKRIVVPGLATLDFIEERKREWGKDSPLYKIHVLGEFVELEEGRLFPADLVAAAEGRWASTKAEGRLVIGLDPAGESGDGDESAFVCRRGKRVLQITARRGLKPDAHVVEVLGLAKALGAGETPLVVVDRDGYVGAKVYAALAAYRSQHEAAFDLRGVRGGERAKRQPMQIDRVRDEVWLALVDALRDGLAIPEDVRLERELAAIQLERHVSGRSKVTGKDSLRRELGRSPDRADALALCVAVGDVGKDEPPVGGTAAGNDPYDAEPDQIFSPYEGSWL